MTQIEMQFMNTVIHAMREIAKAQEEQAKTQKEILEMLKKGDRNVSQSN